MALLRDLYGDDWARFTADFVPPPGVASWDGAAPRRGADAARPGGNGSRVVAALDRRSRRRNITRSPRRRSASADPGALFFGDRLPIYYDPDAVRAETPYVDAIAVNDNVDSPEGWIAPYFFDGLRALSGAKPVLVSEWFYAATRTAAATSTTAI